METKLKYKFPVKEILRNPDIKLPDLEKTYIIGSENRAISEYGEIDLSEKEKYYEFIYDDGTSWYSDAETITELFPTAEKSDRDGNDNKIIYLPLSLNGNNQDRNFVTKIVLKIIHVFTKPAEDKLVKETAEKLENGHLNGYEGLNTLNENFELKAFDESQKVSDKAYLLFIHGTNSDTLGAFSALKKNETFTKIRDIYGDSVLAFQHRTLTESPLKNAVDLAKKLPDNGEFHIISHSRGGLVGDVLCKYSENTGFSKDHIELLKKEKREEDIANIQELDEIFKTKKIRITKFIRVASPSAGTILASERIDHILNVFFNLIVEKASMIATLTHDLIATVLKHKSNINTLPGLEAMNPQSDFIKILNHKGTENGIEGNSLMVISGNGKLSINFHGLLVILGKLFYTQRNDLVVNTDSMYLGVRRLGDIQYFFDEGTSVDHIHYFDNKKTQDAILNALKTQTGELIPGYSKIPQFEIPSSDRGALGLDNGELFPSNIPPSGKKPIVVLLPGIMGSNIYNVEEKNRIWLNYWNIVRGGLEQMHDVTSVSNRAQSIIKSSYGKLSTQLSFNYDVVVFPFDWRKKMKDSAKELDDKINYLLTFNQPIKVIGHSMGGVLMRDFIAYHPETWTKLNNSKDFKLLFLGSPLKGSHRILSVLFGKDGIINKLSFLDMKHSKKELIQIFSKLPGILSLLPFTNDKNDNYADVKTWELMRNGFEDASWPIPNESDLNDFKEYRDKINALVSENKIDFTNASYIAGQDKATPCGHKFENGKLIFEATREGDQSVTWKSGIPQTLIDKKKVYYSNVTHGELANDTSLFTAIEEIISKGATDKISQNKPVFRGESTTFRYVEDYDFDFSQNGLENSIFGIKNEKEVSVNDIPITVSISHGDLSYASFPVIAGHFKNDGILYAEKAIDYNVNYMLSQKNQLGVYPGEIGTCEIIERQNYFEGTIIIGLGETGKLTSYLLSQSVELSLTNYLLNKSNLNENIETVGISALFIASNFGGLTIESSMKAIIEGINNANKNSVNLNSQKYCVINHLEFIELYESNAVMGLYALKKIVESENDVYNIYVENYRIKKLFGSKEKLPLENGEDWWNRISVKTKNESLVFSLNTRDARQEENEVYSSTSLVSEFVKEISVENRWTDSISRTLFEMLIPNDFKEKLMRKGNIVWLVDKESASYPWEILQDNSKKAKPLCIDSGMIRQLATSDYRPKIDRVLEDKVLIVADPDLQGFVNQLNGAVREGNAINEVMTNKGFETMFLVNASASKIIESVFSQSHKVMHLCGHGLYDPENPQNSGMVIGNNIFFTPFHIKQMSTVPELVFVNCCHLGNIDGVDERFYQNRFKLAANIGTQLIDNGVKAVVVAGWQVNDDDAETFSTEFYRKMLEGETFGKAVKYAREKIYENSRDNNNTWGAYQCYGDPFYKLTSRSKSKLEKKNYILEEEVLIDLKNLLNKLDVRKIKSEDILPQIDLIRQGSLEAAISSPSISEAEAYIYYELGMYKEALQILNELRTNKNTVFTVSALEKYCNTTCYLCYEDFVGGKMTSGTATAEIQNIIRFLKDLINIKQTAERLGLLASSYKRFAFVSTGVQKRKNLEFTCKNYLDAYGISKKMYPLNNYLTYQSILDFDQVKKEITPKKKNTYLDLLEDHKKALKNTSLNMDYWDSSDYAFSDLSILFLDHELAKKDSNWQNLYVNYKQTRERYGSIGKKKAELFNLELIIDAFDVLTKDASGKIKNRDAALLKTKTEELLRKLRR
ncbi:CHAT domain-containing protein [Chryseobacterium sp. PBS4-4]|uniref:CHAT domain-containing protein n=1 Tax=Chryseobacterium edaphi TaxID=2976532 RepID=A0ABT2W5W8_9FLAO|nr:CHAT domain-containing protein [Chryseobacterium edaphi]MCU7617369.1 CHAT domain-containing protein [Chryseobacterium edaphi]